MSAVSAEYFALQGVRATSVGESSARATLYFATITGTLVALGLLSSSVKAPTLQWAFVAASPLLGLIGLTSFLRIVETSIEDVAAIRAMNRLRTWMTATSPALQALITVPRRANQPGNEFLNTGAQEHPGRILLTLGSTVGIINSAQIAIAAAIAVHFAGTFTAGSVIAGVAIGTMLSALHANYQLRRYRAAVAAWQSENTRHPVP